MGFRRNLIIVVAHGLRSDALDDSGSWPLSTPNLSKLARQGLRVAARSACPADPGALASLITGLHARQHGYLDAAGPVALRDGWPAWLTGAGYHLAGVGCVGPVISSLKQSVLVDPVTALDSETCAYLQAAAAKGHKDAIIAQRRQRLRYGPFEPDRLLLEPEDDIDGFISSQARRMLAHMPADKPWAMMVMLTGPGNDLPPPTIYSQIVDPETVSGGFMPSDLTQIDALAELDYPRVMLQRLEPEKIGRIRSDYLGRVALIDYGVGRLATAAAARPDRERTWMLVCSDRGQLLGEHGLVGHRSFLSGALEVPVLLVPPTATAPAAGQAALGISSVDIAATIADLAGCDLPSAAPGRSLLPLLRARSGPDRERAMDFPSPALDKVAAHNEALLSEFGKRLMLETERHKVIFDSETRHAIGLYDLINDPDEHENLVTRPTGLNLLDSLRWRLGDALLPLRALPS